MLGLCAAPAVAADPWASLHRGLHLPRVAPGAACPVSPADESVNWKAARIFGGSGTGKGPVYPGLGSSNGRVDVARDEQFGGPWLGSKVFWYATPAYRGRALIRGARIDGPQPLGFNGEKTPDPELRIELGDTVQWDGQPAQSRGVASSVRVRAAGCYAVQIDGASFSGVVVFGREALSPRGLRDRAVPPYVPAMRRTWIRLTPLLAAAVLAGCGGGDSGSSPTQELADCLNGQGYDVTASGDEVTGSSPGGAEFTATLKDDKLTIDDSASQAGTGLGDQDRTSIELCTDERFQPTSG